MQIGNHPFLPFLLPSHQERRVPYRRGAELDALTGTRFALSLLLEALDVGLPLGRRAERVQVVEQTAGLVLLHVEAGEAQQAS